MKKNQLIALALLFLCALAVSACTSSSAMNGSTSWPGVTAEGDTVYAANGGQVDAVRDGQKVWSYPESANNRISFFAAPAVDGSFVYAGSYTNQLHIINKEDGTPSAVIEVGNNKNKIIAAPIVADGNVIVLSSGGMVSSYPAGAKGETVSANWQRTLSSEVWVKPVFEDGTLYVASMDKKMNVIDAATGELKKSYDISGAVMSDPVLDGGKLYFSTLAKEVDEMDPVTGEIRVLLTTTGEIWASPLLKDGRLYAADMSGCLYCIDIKTAEPVWTTERVTAEKTGFIASPAALNDGNILFMDEGGEVMTYDAEGKSVGQRTLGQPVYTTPVLLENGNFVLVPVSSEAQVRAYTPDLKEDWTFIRSAKAESKEETKESK